MIRVPNSFENNPEQNWSLSVWTRGAGLPARGIIIIIAVMTAKLRYYWDKGRKVAPLKSKVQPRSKPVVAVATAI